jgi:hypothetical protein
VSTLANMVPHYPTTSALRVMVNQFLMTLEVGL